MDEQLAELKDRISQMSDSELLRIVEVEYADYRREALEFAQAELTKRFVPFEELTREQMNDVEDDEVDSELSADVGPPCNACGGAMRAGLLFSDRELTILFRDNSEERFVQALVCRRCGTVRLVVDLETEVEG